jgi:UDP-glucose:(glucosyl)LPS alpha-1,2-glucosyltransferase
MVLKNLKKVRERQSIHMNPKGGTEILKEQLIAQLPEQSIDGINLIGSICHPSLVKEDKINILWQHLNYDQPNVKLMQDRKFVDSIDYFIYVSHWQYNRFREVYKIPEYKSFVIKNATHAFEPVKKESLMITSDKIKLLYTSTPWRGLIILLKVIEILNKTRDDFEVDIYSSTKIYGSKFDENEKDKFTDLFDKCKNTKNVNYHGYTFNGEIRRAVEKAHIYAYPSIFEETSCLAVIEAMAAGCHVVTTNYGALPETCGEFATMIEFDSSGQNLIERYAETLNSVIDNYKNNLYKDDLEMQIKYYNKNYSWETRIQEWINFLNYVRRKKTS